MFMFVTVGFATWTKPLRPEPGLYAGTGRYDHHLLQYRGDYRLCLSGSIAVKCRMSHREFLIVSLAAMGVMTVLFSMQRGYAGLIIVGCVWGHFLSAPPPLLPRP